MEESGLDPHQYSAVTSDPSKSLVIRAGPGAGKTRTLVARVEFLLNVSFGCIFKRLKRNVQKGIPPSKIAVFTFTNKAANELKERLSKKFADSHK